MATAHTRPAGSYSPTETTNANKYVTDSGSSTAISSLKVDADFNYIIDAMNALSSDIDNVIATGLPAQTGNADKFLTTDGSLASWAKVNTANIEDGAITTAKMLDTSVTEAKLSSAVQTKLNRSAPNKFDATTAPTADWDDSDTAAVGTVFAVGSVVIDTVANEAYRCLDATTGAAVWINTTLTTSELGTAALLDVGTGANNIVQLNGSSQLPAVDGSQLTNLITGKVLQVQSTTTQANTASASTTYVTGVTTTITPSATTSTILAILSFSGLHGGAVGATAGVRISRGGTPIVTSNQVSSAYSTANTPYSGCLIHLDSPSSTSLLTYTGEVARTVGSGTVYMNGTGSQSTTLTLVEIGI